MENEISQDNKEELINITANYFKLDFPNQETKNNTLFEQFKKEKLNKLGNESKLFHCKADNIYFYASKKDSETSFYYRKCPLCNNYICYFCQRTLSQPMDEKANCCRKLKLYYLFTKKGFEFLNNLENLEPIKKSDFKIVLLVFFTPFLFLFTLFVEITNILGFGLLLKKQIWNYNIDDPLTTYSNYYEQNYCFELLMAIVVINSIFYSICFTIYSIYINIFILVVSLFYKFYPLKYCVGVLVNGI